MGTIGKLAVIGRAGPRLSRRRLIPILAAILAIGGIWANGAQAEQTHLFLSTFNAADAPLGAFAPMQGSLGVAVDNSGTATDGRVYVGDTTAHSVVDVFDPSGAYLSQFDGSETVSGSFTPWGIAVDETNGDLFVADIGYGFVLKYDTAGKIIKAFGTEGGISGATTPQGSFSPTGVALDPAGNVYVGDNAHGVIDVFGPGGAYLRQFASNGGAYSLATDSQGNLFVTNSAETDVYEYATGALNASYGGGSGRLDAGGSIGVAVDPANDDVYLADGDHLAVYDKTGALISNFGRGHVSSAFDIDVNDGTGHVYDTNRGSANASIFGPIATVPDAITKTATNIGPTSATLAGHVDPDAAHGGGAIEGCFFEYGTDTSYGLGKVPCEPAVPISGPADVTANIGGLTKLDPVTTYHYRVLANNSVGTNYGGDQSFTTLPAVPDVTEAVTDVHSESALVHAQINPGGGETNYHFEYATEAEYEVGGTYTHTVPVPDGELPAGLTFVAVSSHLEGLAEGTVYHWRVVAANTTGTTDGPDRTFTTFPFVSLLEDPCANIHVRQQTGAAQLLDCRAYELVSAPDTGGHEVISDLVPGQVPYPDYPLAENPSRVLYSIRDGGIPGTNHPTNRGPDPYVATRDPELGWGTEYVGVPANNPFAAKPFSSARSGADARLETLAFGGAEGCSPCFAGGYTGIPVHLPDGTVVQGMSGPEDPGPGAKPDGYVAENLSANGEHFVFGSTSRFAPGGNSGGDVSIYDHNLRTGQTLVVSNTPNAEPLPCLQGAGKCNAENSDSNGISELAISSDGSRILLGQKVATDADGNIYWHLYMDIGDSVHSIDVTPGATQGALFDGMVADGSMVFFTTADSLGAGDTDTSADLYRAQVSGSGVTVTEISTGIAGTGSTNFCEPVSNSGGEHWNTVGSVKNCNVVAIEGDGGIAANEGSAYFLSPEKLDGAGNGASNQPNLYVARPGSAPHFIATLDPEDPVVVDSRKEGGTLHTADFQVTGNGLFAVIPTDRQLGEFDNAGFQEIYRYDASADALDCTSCDPTNAEAAGSSSLAGFGLSIAEDGRVFFNSDSALVLRDADNRQDVYEWEPQGTGNCQPDSPTYSKQAATCLSLISSGAAQFDSSLLGASADGVDAYIFARESLTPQVDNGKVVRIYDARELGGFPYAPPDVPCKASDECHGAGSPIPPIPTIPSAAGSGGNVSSDARPKCKPGFHRKHGKCVRRHPKPRRSGSKKHHGGRS